MKTKNIIFNQKYKKENIQYKSNCQNNTQNKTNNNVKRSFQCKLHNLKTILPFIRFYTIMSLSLILIGFSIFIFIYLLSIKATYNNIGDWWLLFLGPSATIAFVMEVYTDSSSTATAFYTRVLANTACFYIVIFAFAWLFRDVHMDDVIQAMAQLESQLHQYVNAIF